MTIKLLQLNINGDNYWERLVSYLISHDFDIIQLQEVTGKDTHSGNIHSQRDVFAELQKKLSEKYDAELVIAQRYTSSPFSYMGNGTFFKKSFSLLGEREIRLSTYGRPFPSDLKTYEGVGRKILHLKLKIGNKQISFLNTHAAWGGDNIEKPFQTEQGETLISYLKTVEPPFVLSGDFNLTPEQPFIQKITSLTQNLTVKNKITNTLNPNNHRAKDLFPKGLAVDYIFASNDLKTKEFAVIDEGLSDHFGLKVDIET